MDAQIFKRYITTTYRKNVIPILLAIGLAWPLTMLGYNFISYLGAEDSIRRPYSMQIDSDPITIAASTVGDFSQTYSWHLSINSAGAGVLTICSAPNAVTRNIEVSKDELNVIRMTIKDERFFLN